SGLKLFRGGGVGDAARSVAVLCFFQAEDGIRDKLVTGVQTCALPISAGASVGRAGCARAEEPGEPMLFSAAIGGGVRRGSGFDRSEERRVGKEWRSRRGPERHRKNRTRGRGRDHAAHASLFSADTLRG